jgi:amidophosphoribosyltransferase
MAVTFPAIRHPCFMGIDFPDPEQLLAHVVADGEKDPAREAAKVAEAIGVESFFYNDVDGLCEAIGLPKDSLCFACVTGDYSKLGVQPPIAASEEAKA